MQYMNTLVPEDLKALNELAKLTWAWEIRYWTEKGLGHGSFILRAVNPLDKAWYSFDGETISETVQNFFIKVNKDYILLPIPDYP